MHLQSTCSALCDNNGIFHSPMVPTCHTCVPTPMVSASTVLRACNREEGAGQALALHWVGEQIEGARAALAAARSALKDLKAVERKRAQKVWPLLPEPFSSRGWWRAVAVAGCR